MSVRPVVASPLQTSVQVITSSHQWKLHQRDYYFGEPSINAFHQRLNQTVNSISPQKAVLLLSLWARAGRKHAVAPEPARVEEREHLCGRTRARARTCMHTWNQSVQWWDHLNHSCRRSLQMNQELINFSFCHRRLSPPRSLNLLEEPSSFMSPLSAGHVPSILPPPPPRGSNRAAQLKAHEHLNWSRHWPNCAN